MAKKEDTLVYQLFLFYVIPNRFQTSEKFSDSKTHRCLRMGTLNDSMPSSLLKQVKIKVENRF